MNGKFTVVQVSLKDIFHLRHDILRPGLPKESALFDGDYELFTYHFAVYKTRNGRIVGKPLCCASFKLDTLNKRDSYRLRGMATDKNWQGRGLGSLLMSHAESFIANKTGVKLFWCNARSSAVKFYYDRGWRAFSEEFEIKGVGPHHKMKKELV